MVALGGGALVVVEVRWDVIGRQLLEDFLLQGGLLMVAMGAVAAATVQDLNAVTQVLAASHAVVVGVISIEGKRVHNAGVSGVVQDAL